MGKKEKAAKNAAFAMQKELDSEMTEEERAAKEKSGMGVFGGINKGEEQLFGAADPAPCRAPFARELANAPFVSRRPARQRVQWWGGRAIAAGDEARPSRHQMASPRRLNRLCCAACGMCRQEALQGGEEGGGGGQEGGDRRQEGGEEGGGGGVVRRGTQRFARRTPTARVLPVRRGATAALPSVEKLRGDSRVPRAITRTSARRRYPCAARCVRVAAQVDEDGNPI
eukprot:4901598-Prymnesium_polylepis.1